ncbi:MAG: uroporphyrinogen decarboxylase family protein [Chloroflexota bacterium]|nr:uroporphyrinogen decarboxylase family protein [Chloroflexota bacterium]
MGGMTSRERVIRAIRREPTDCVAAMPYMYDIAAVTAGVSLRDFYTDPRTMVEAQLVLHDKVGQDVIAIGADNYYIAEGFGCITTRSEDELPSLETPPLADINDVFDLEVPDPYKDGRMPVMLEGIRLARQAVGEEAVVRSPGTGPFALASYLIGTQEWLMEIALIEAGIEGANEKAVLHALELTTEALIRFGKACWDAGADILHNGDSLASCNVISPRTYERFAYPYQKRVFTAWAEHGVTRKLLHICGDSTKVLHLYADTGADMVEIDNAVDMAVAKRLIGDRVAVVGNVHTVTELLQGTPESVATSAQRCIDDAGSGGGFLLGSGCIVPRYAPLENMQAMVRVAHSQPYPGM